ncbi:MAG: GNAT family N-acetyltransferase [Lachnospiraceae bacterium]|nr:GNAT family N-acetyltransferase [Lachnospiraceae bacterium]
MHRLYEYGDIAVFWDSEKCRHAKRCVTGSPRTFDIQRKPWIDITQAPTMEIWQTIEKCPTGALTCVYTHETVIELDPDRCRSVAYLNPENAPDSSDTDPAGSGRQQVGECDYKKTDEGWVIYHTEVAPEHEGKGIAKRLVYKIVEAAEREKANVIPTCSYAGKVLSGR